MVQRLAAISICRIVALAAATIVAMSAWSATGRGALAQGAPPVSITSTSQGTDAAPSVAADPNKRRSSSRYQLFGANDLGMHCGDLDSRVVVILPPFNVVHAQVVKRGAEPKLLTSKGAAVIYSAASNPDDPLRNRTPLLAADGSVFKTNFWDVARQAYAPFYPPGVLEKFYPASLDITDVGLPVVNVEELYLGSGALKLYQATMPSITTFKTRKSSNVPVKITADPYRANEPQRMPLFERDFPLFASLPFGYVAPKVNWFTAAGIPITTFDDAGRENPFPLMRLQAAKPLKSGKLGKPFASLDVVVPVSGEADCKGCHTAAPTGNGLATAALTTAGREVATPQQDPRWGHVPVLVSEEWAADLNMLRLHDLKHPADSLESAIDPVSGIADAPVACQTCHYSPALDLAQVGPQTTAGGLKQANKPSMSKVMHAGHAAFTHNGQPLFAEMPPPTDPRRTEDQDTAPVNAFEQGRLEASCYQCHPGKRTQCLRGAMYSAGILCQDCHGQMAQVGRDASPDSIGGSYTIAADFYTHPDTPRMPWLNEPGCGSCHTGDAIDNLAGTAGTIAANDGIRLIQAYLSGDAKATPIVPDNRRFAENRVASGAAAGNPKLFRLSTDPHSGMSCQSCHGSTHAEWPNAIAAANDNRAAKQLQGHAGVITECETCHTGRLGATLGGPHGMHPVGNDGFSAAWTKNHGDFAEKRGRLDRCAACHGASGEGTVLARVRIDRPGLSCEEGSLCQGREGKITLAAGTLVGCGSCHENPYQGGGGDDD